MMRHFLHSISAKMFLAMIILYLIPITLLIHASSNFNTQNLLLHKQYSDLNTLNIFSSQMDSLLASIESVGYLASRNEEVLSFIRTAQKRSEAEGKIIYKEMDSSRFSRLFCGANDEIIAFSIMDAEHFFIGEQLLDYDRLTYFFNPTTLEPVSKTPDVCHWTKTFTIEQGGLTDKVFSLIYPCFEQDGSLLGYVVLYVNTDLFKEQLMAYEDTLYIIEGNSIIGNNSHTLNTNLFTELQISYSVLIENKSIITNPLYQPLVITTQYYEPLGFHLLLVSSYQELTDSLQSRINQKSYILFIVSAVLLIFLTTGILVRCFTKPITQLRKIMTQNRDGNLSLRYTPTTQDEISDLGGTFNSLLDRIEHLLNEQQENQKERRKLEFRLMYEQVKPHFLYNILEMINSLIRCDLTEEAIDTVSSLSEFYRLSLNQGMDIIPLSQEKKLIETYLHLQKSRYIEFMDYMIILSPNILMYQIPKLTLQPLIENSIYHGLKENDRKGIICLSGYVKENRITIEIYDNGKGIPPETLSDLQKQLSSPSGFTEEHFGLASVIRRLNIYFDNQAQLTIDSVYKEYTCVTVTFPAIELISST